MFLKIFRNTSWSARRATTLPRFATDGQHRKTQCCYHNVSSLCRGITLSIMTKLWTRWPSCDKFEVDRLRPKSHPLSQRPFKLSAPVIFPQTCSASFPRPSPFSLVLGRGFWLFWPVSVCSSLFVVSLSVFPPLCFLVNPPVRLPVSLLTNPSVVPLFARLLLCDCSHLSVCLPLCFLISPPVVLPFSLLTNPFRPPVCYCVTVPICPSACPSVS